MKKIKQVWASLTSSFRVSKFSGRAFKITFASLVLCLFMTSHLLAQSADSTAGVAAGTSIGSLFTSLFSSKTWWATVATVGWLASEILGSIKIVSANGVVVFLVNAAKSLLSGFKSPL